ncbi:hypothetical protein PMI14_00629 [Acidovorax sp. CF316]|nr:hypothetical protein PMI14_00629 [Acidovorax sp. CF316]
MFERVFSVLWLEGCSILLGMPELERVMVIFITYILMG